MPSDFIVIGLTGGSGAGKSIASDTLTEMGIPCLDTDLVSRLVCGVNCPCTVELGNAFGNDILTPEGALRRDRLAATVFGESDPDFRQKKLSLLNHITHRYILDYSRKWLSDQKKSEKKAACIDAPQLFESGFDKECDRILGVTANKELRIARIIKRDFITEDAAKKRIAAQHDDTYFAEHCTVLLYNDGDILSFKEQVFQVVSSWLA